MSLARDTFKQIKCITTSLIEVSLCNDQNIPIKKPNVPSWDNCEIVIPSKEVVSALKNVKYEELYSVMNQNRNFNFRLIDGALLTMQYEFKNDKVLRHTLGYYPNPDLLAFQENEEIYLEDDVYLDIFDKRVMVVPLRFDFDNREDVPIDVIHPRAHFTLGQFEKCRIPVTRPLMPCQFVHFVLRNFYNSAYMKYKDKIYISEEKFEETITANEKKIVHISV
jgi:hypothetical protein